MPPRAFGWAYVFLPWWGLNALADGRRWSDAVLAPGVGASTLWSIYRSAFYALPLAALMGTGAVLGRWRPRRGTLTLAGLFGAASVFLLCGSLVALPAHAFVRRRFFPPPAPRPRPPAPPPETAPVSAPAPAPPSEPERGRAGLAFDLARRLEEAERKREEAVSIVSATQADVKAGRAGTRPRLQRAQRLLGEAIDACARIQDAQDARREPVPGEVMRTIHDATEAQKVVRSLLFEAN